MKDVKGRTAFITGGASGIGLGMARAFVNAGMRVVLADLRPDHIDVALAQFARAGHASSVHAIRKNRPAQFGVGEAYRAAESAGAAQVAFPSQMEPAEAGARVLQAVLNDEFYIITHGEWKSAAERRHAAIVAAMPDKLDPLLVAMLESR